MGDRVETTTDAMAANATADAGADKVKPGGEELPLVTFALFAYNQEEYIREAMEGALAQDYPNLEIIISDDCSTDRTWEIIERCASEYAGAHRLVLNRNQSNQGICGHVNSVFLRSSGQLIVVAAGDDISYENRVSEFARAWISHGRKEAVIHCRSRIVNINAPTTNIVDPIMKSSGIVDVKTYVMEGMRLPIKGQSAAYTPGIFGKFGPLDSSGSIEDETLVFRAIMLGASIIFVDKVLLDYRMTGENISMSYWQSGQQRILDWLMVRYRCKLQQQIDYNAAGLSDPEIVLSMQKEAKRLLRCQNLGSSNPIRVAIGVVSFTQGKPLKERAYLIMRFFNLLDGRLHRAFRRTKMVFSRR